MDLIYTDETGEEIGILLDYSLDLAFGAGENDFRLELSIENNECVPNGWIYIEGTEYGGIIDSVTVDTKLKKIRYEGRTYHGILNSKIIEPNKGEDYFIISGEGNGVLSALIEKLGLQEVFKVSNELSGCQIDNYQFSRYIAGYEGITKMLASVGYKLKVERIEGNTILSVLPIMDYSTDEELDSDQVAFEITQRTNKINHLICLGRGELKDREVLHLYADAGGNISNMQTLRGKDEYVDIFDYSSAESSDELMEYGVKRFEELLRGKELEVGLDNRYNFDIGDIIMASENITGISISRAVSKKIVTIRKRQLKVEYKVGK